MRILFVLVIGILILGTISQSQKIEAQDLVSSNYETKPYQKMDSALAELYQLKNQGKILPSSTLISTDGEKVKVVIELLNVEVGIPQRLGIEVETSYENRFQAKVPIKNLQKIASEDNVKFILLPGTLVSTTQTGEGDITSSFQPEDGKLEFTSQPTDTEFGSTFQTTDNEENSEGFNFAFLAIILVIVMPIIFYIIRKRRK